MKFKLDSMDLVAALDVVSKVRPQALKSSKEDKSPTAVYLFSVHDGKCYVYSRDSTRVVRVDFPVSDIEGEEEDFTYPINAVEAFRYLIGTITFETSKDGDKFKVEYSNAEGAKGERYTLNPKFIAKCEEQMVEKKSSVDFPSKVLQLGLDTTKTYLPAKDDRRCPDHYKSVQIYDASRPEWAAGDGVMLTADSIRLGYFECAAYKGKGLPIYVEHVGVVSSFLGYCEGKVTVHNGDQMVFFEDEKGRVLGIQHQVEDHPKFRKMKTEEDTVVLRVDKDSWVRVLKHIEASLPEKQTKVRIRYQHGSGKLSVAMSESSTKADVGVTVRGSSGKDPQNFDLAVNIKHLLDMFVPTQCNEVEFRIRLYKKDTKTTGMLSTVDHYWVDNQGKIASDTTQPDVHECSMTRVLPSMS